MASPWQLLGRTACGATGLAGGLSAAWMVSCCIIHMQKIEETYKLPKSGNLKAVLICFERWSKHEASCCYLQATQGAVSPYDADWCAGPFFGRALPFTRSRRKLPSLAALLYPRKYRAQNARESVTTARSSIMYNLEFLPSKTCPHLSSIDPKHAP